MSCRREAATNAFSSALPPATKREFFHASKYSDIVGVITTSAVNASCSVGAHSLRGGVELLGGLLELARGGDVEVGVGDGLAEADLAVAVEVGLDALGGELRLGAEGGGLDQVVEVARAVPGLAGRRLQRDRRRVLRVALVGARVDDHVVVGERRDAGDDALHLLVGRIGRREVLLRLLDERLDVGALVLQQLRVVEVGLLGHRVIRLGALAELRRVLGERRGVLQQEVLHGLEIRLRGGGGRAGGRLESSSSPPHATTPVAHPVATRAAQSRLRIPCTVCSSRRFGTLRAADVPATLGVPNLPKNPDRASGSWRRGRPARIRVRPPGR